MGHARRGRRAPLPYLATGAGGGAATDRKCPPHATAVATAVACGGRAWLEPRLRLHCRFLSPERECLVGHFAPCQLTPVCRFHGQSFPWVQATTSCGRVRSA